MNRKDLLKLLDPRSVRINETNPTFEEIYDDPLIVYGSKIKQKFFSKTFEPLKPYYGFIASSGRKMTTEELTDSQFKIGLMNYYTLSGNPIKVEEAMLYYVTIPYLHNKGGATPDPEDFTDPSSYNMAMGNNVPCIVSPLELSSYIIPEVGKMVKIRFLNHNMNYGLIIGVMNAPVILAKTVQPYIVDLIGTRGSTFASSATTAVGANVAGYNRNMPIGNTVCNNGKVFNQGGSEHREANKKVQEVGKLTKTKDNATWNATIALLGSFIRQGESSGGRPLSDENYNITSKTGRRNLTTTPVKDLFGEGDNALGAYQHLSRYLDERLNFIIKTCPDEQYTKDSLFDKKMQDDMFADMVLNRVTGIGGYIRGADMDLSQAIIEFGGTFMAVGMPFNGVYEAVGGGTMNLYKDDCYNPEKYSARRESSLKNNRATLESSKAAEYLKAIRATYLTANGLVTPSDKFTTTDINSCF